MSYIEDVSLRATSANMPELVVEWMPTQGPGASDGDWCDITEYVTTGNTSRGRQYELDAFKAGTASLTLETFTRLFDPENVDGPFYPWLTPMRQIRISAVYNSVRYAIFRGYVTSWGQTQPSDKKFVTTIDVRDGFERLEQLKLPTSAWALEVQKDNPSCWMRPGETGTTRLTDSSAGGNYGVFDNAQQGAEGLIVNDSDGAVGFAHSLEERVVIQNPSLISGYPFTVSMMFQIDNSDPAGQKVLFSGLGAPPSLTTNFVAVMMDGASTAYAIGAGYIIFTIVNSSATAAYVWTSQRYDDGKPHYITLVAGTSSKADWYIYVDGVDVTTRGGGSPVSWTVVPPGGYVVGNFTDLLWGDYGFGAGSDGPGTIDELTVYDAAVLDSSRIAAQYAAAFGWDGDDSGARVARFLDAIEWPANLRDIDSGASTLGPASWSEGSSALSALQAWADTELGQFLIGTNGELIWKSRHAAILDANSTTSQATFSDTHSGGLKCDTIDLPRDATLIRNPVTASRRDGVSVTVQDTALIQDKYGPRTWAAPNSEDQKDSAVRDRALWLLARYKEQGTRLSGLTITPTQDPTNLYPQALGRVIGDRITVNRTPLGIGSAINVDQIIEGVDHSFTPFTWTTTFTGSPVDPNVADYLILDGAGTTGYLDQQLLAY